MKSLKQIIILKIQNSHFNFDSASQKYGKGIQNDTDYNLKINSNILFSKTQFLILIFCMWIRLNLGRGQYLDLYRLKP